MTHAPVTIIGSGAAGLSAALALAPYPVRLLTKTPTLWSGSTPHAQGGLAGALDAADSTAAHAADTLTAGAGLSDAEAVNLLTRAAPAILDQIIEQGFPADRGADGAVTLGREGGHSANRILHAGGDRSGAALAMTLLDQVQRCPSISIMTGCFAWDITRDTQGRVKGVIAHDAERGWIEIPSAAVIIATGGIGQLFPVTTNPAESTGDGLAMAARAGAELMDVEFMQFHPTGLVTPDGHDNQQSPLISEALRGAGALLVDQHGRRFMAGRHPLAELAPRDVVTRAIVALQREGGTAYLDLRPVAASHGEAAFPQAFTGARAAGYDPLAQPIPIGPTAHFHMGGIRTDLNGQSSISGLYACGEVAATGLHGANRLASNSLTEALVMGRRTGRAALAHLARFNDQMPDHIRPLTTPPIQAQTGDNGTRLRARIKRLSGKMLGAVRNGPDMQAALHKLSGLSAAADQLACTIPALEVRNMVLVAQVLAIAALARCESRGGHTRSDFPQQDPAQARSTVMTWPETTLRPLPARHAAHAA